MSRGRQAFRVCTQDCFKLDFAEPAIRSALAPGVVSAGTWTWSRCGHRTGSIGYYWNGERQALQLRYSVGGDGVTQHIRLAATRPRYGGLRFWFVCGHTGANARVLYLPPGGRHFFSREAYRLVYPSSRESGSAARLFRLLARHEAFGAVSDDWLSQINSFSDPFGVKEESRAAAQARRRAIRKLRRIERSNAEHSERG